ncbi:T9SS type A sorting domain-containing protein [candidate division TA06 bacterium]|uniref:T9SS type A sorting domain-containing protein n=1 Tax=candidate division TA06 bacterium TaxID=2250710 RepID=A0A933I9Z4_UNCT6|nr:T9SS type A sorting domain-containing protein [candidate division TA06 bacterium]
MIKIAMLLLLLLPSLASAQVIAWGSRVRVDDAPGDTIHPASHPYTIIDDSLRIFSAWEDDRDNDGKHAICFARSNDRGGTFSTNIAVAPDTVDNVYPWLVKGSKNSVYVVWQALDAGNNWKIYFSRSGNGGNTFDAPDTVQGINIYNPYDGSFDGPTPKVAVDPRDSILYLVWTNYESGIGRYRVKCARSLTRNNVFIGETFVSSPDSQALHPAVDVGDNGKVFVAYVSFDGNNQDKCEIVSTHSADYGLTFDSTRLLVNDDPGSNRKRDFPNLYRTGNKVAVIWQDTRLQSNTQPNLFFSQKSDSQTAFSANIKADNGGGTNNYSPRIAVDRTNNNLVIAWHSNARADGGFELRMCAYNDTVGQFRPSYTVPNTYTGTSTAGFGKDYYPPALAIANINSVTNFFLVWQDLGEDASGNIYCIRGTVTNNIPHANLDELKVYPNPFKKWLGYGNVTFENLTATATIKIFDIKGRLVTTIEETNGDGEAIWNPNVASGIYLYLATNSQGQKKTGKIAILK